MGSGSYSHESYTRLASSKAYGAKSAREIFSNSMNIKNDSRSFNKSVRTYNVDKVDETMINIGVRQSVDSEEHPNTTPIIIAFDVTGSMGRIPHMMIKEYLPKILLTLQEAGVPDPQVMFMAFGDQYSDYHPIQATQFESDTEKIQNSLESLYLEGGGGGNGGESPALAYAIAGYHTEIDSWYKRGKKGFMFTISDEPCHPQLESEAQVEHLGYEKGTKSKSAAEIISKAKEQYNIFHLHMDDGAYSVRSVESSWKELLGDHFLHCKSSELLEVIPKLILENIEVTSETTSDKTSESKEEYSY